MSYTSVIWSLKLLNSHTSSHVFSVCGHWINVDTYSSDVTQQKLPFRICISAHYCLLTQIRVPARCAHMEGNVITIGGSLGIKTSPSAFLSIPGLCTDRFVCYWRNGTQKKWLVRRRRKVHDLKCTIDSREMCFSSFVCVCLCTDASVFFIPLWWAVTIFSGRGTD